MKEGDVRQLVFLAVCVMILVGVIGCVRFSPSEPVCGSILYQESFGGSGSGWPQSTEGQSKAWIEDGRYRVEVPNAFSYVYLRNEDQGPYADLCYSARVWDLSDEKAQFVGLMFRCTEAGQFYVFSIHPDSHAVSFAVFLGDRARPIRVASSDAVRGVGEANDVQVIAEGNHFLFYVNDELVLEEFDDSLSAGGIGVSGASGETAPAVLAFDDLVVRRLE